MAQLSIEELEELILTRDSYLHEAQASGREVIRLKEQLAIMQNAESPFQQSAADTAVKLREMLAAKDAEIARLTALLNVTPQPAQEQADEHPAKKGWINPGSRDERWSPFELNGPWSWAPAENYWDEGAPAIIAAYDRYMAQQEGGQAQ